MITFPTGVKPPLPLPYGIIGAGPGSFIGHVGWTSHLESDRRFRFAGAAPSRKPENIEWFKEHFGVTTEPVVSDYRELITIMNRNYGARWVLCITTETSNHAEILIHALKNGVKLIMVDKPLVTTVEESEEIVKLARRHNAVVVVTFNHRYNAGILTIRQAIEDALKVEGPAGITSLNAWFVQGWLCDDPHSRQSEWRLNHPWCTLLDLWTHVYDLSEFVLGANGVRIFEPCCQTLGHHGHKTYDTGKGEVLFNNGVRGGVFASQAREGFLDGIGIAVTFRNPDRPALMFNMEFGGADGVYVGDAKSQWNVRESWKFAPRGTKSVPAAIANQISLNPVGHVQGWGDMWRLLFSSAAGKFHLHLGELAKDQLPAQMALPVPLAEDAGRQTIHAVTALVRGHEGGKGEIDIYQPGDPALAEPLMES